MSTTDAVTVSDFDEISSVSSGLQPSELDYAEEREYPGAQKHERFYFGDGSIVIQVERKTYRLHHFFLHRDSRYFARLFPTCPTGDESGANDVSVKLSNTSSADFDALLSILYPRDLRRPEVTTADGWTSVLRVATKLEFDDFRELAIEQLEPIVSPVDMIVLSHELDIHRWLQPAYIALGMRPTPLDKGEARRLGKDDLFLVFTVREDVRPLRRPASQEEVSRLVVEAMAPVSPPTPLPASIGLPNPMSHPLDVPPQPVNQPADVNPPVRSEPPPDAFLSMTPKEVVETKGVKALVAAFTSDDNFDVMSDRVVLWANLPHDQRGRGSLGELVWSILAQGAQDPIFIGPGCRLISKLIENIGVDAIDDSNIAGSYNIRVRLYSSYYVWEDGRAQSYDSESVTSLKGRHLLRAYLQTGVQAILHRPHTADGLSLDAYKKSRPQVILAAASVEYPTLCLNATQFVAELLKANLVAYATVFASLKEHATMSEIEDHLETVRDILPILGPILDFPMGGDSRMDDFLKSLKLSICAPTQSWHDSTWRARCTMQDICDLREKRWVA